VVAREDRVTNVRV